MEKKPPLIYIEKIEYHYHNHIDTVDILNNLQLIKQKLHIMANEFDDLKASLQAANDKLDTVGTNVTGVAADVTFLKQKISDLEAAGGGATPAQIADLKTLADGISAKVDNLAAVTGDLDASTDSATA